MTDDDRERQTDDESLENRLGDEGRDESRRMNPASNPTSPVTIANAADSAMNRPSFPEANGAIIAADNAAVADIGPTIRWRELPAAAYRINDGTAA